MLALLPLLAAEGEVVPTGPSPESLLLVAGLGIVAFVIGHATRRFVSEVIVFLAIGVVVGPTVLGLVDRAVLAALDPVISLALGAIIFGIGQRLELPRLRALRHNLAPVALLENLLVFGLALLGLLAVGVQLSTAYLLAAIAMSTSPTTIVAVVNGRRAGGGYTDLLLATTAVNNVASALVYGLGLPFVLAAAGGTRVGLVAFVQLLVVSAAVGFVGAFVLRRWMHTVHTAGERLLFVLLALLGVVAVSDYLDAPVVISTLVLGAAVANDERDTDAVFDALRTLDDPIFLVFFVVAGADIHLDELATVGVAGAVYVLARVVGKVAGPWVAMQLRGAGRRTGWGPHLGSGLLPFAGMAIGLAAFTIERANAAGLDELAGAVSALVFGSVVVFEVLGPITVGRALDATGDTGQAVDVEVDDDAPHLIHHILVPVSSPEMARRKAPQIVDLASSTRAVVTGLHVVPPGGRADPLVGDPALSLVEQLARTRQVQFEGIVRASADVVGCIADVAREAAVDVVVLGEPVPAPGDGTHPQRRFVHEVAARMPAGVRVFVVPTVPAGEVAPPATAHAVPSPRDDGRDGAPPAGRADEPPRTPVATA